MPEQPDNDGLVLGRGSDQRCGTTAGAARHAQYGEKACPACAAAKAEYDRRWRSAPQRTRLSRLSAKAQSRALKRLKDRHLDEYHALFVAAKREVLEEVGEPLYRPAVEGGGS